MAALAGSATASAARNAWSKSLEASDFSADRRGRTAPSQKGASVDAAAWAAATSPADAMAVSCSRAQAYSLRGPDHRHPAQHVGEETSLIPGRALAGQQPVIVVPAHCRRRDAHPLGYLADDQPAHVAVEDPVRPCALVEIVVAMRAV
jgi:hypothetical protein